MSIYPLINHTRPCLSSTSRCTHFYITLIEIDFSFPLSYSLGTEPLNRYLPPFFGVTAHMWQNLEHCSDRQAEWKLTFKILMCHKIIYFSKEVSEMENIACNTSVLWRRENRLFPCKSFSSTIKTSIKIGSYSWEHSWTAESLPSMWKAIGLISATVKKQKDI